MQHQARLDHAYIYINVILSSYGRWGQVRNQWISGLFGYTQNALTCRIYLAGSVETFTSVKRRCHASRTCFAVSKLQRTFNSWDLSAHRLYRPCGPARTRIVWSALALKKVQKFQHTILFFNLREKTAFFNTLYRYSIDREYANIMLIRDWIGFLLQVSAFHQQKLRLSPSLSLSLSTNQMQNLTQSWLI